MLFIDELQYVEEEQLAALITALHRTAQRRLPVTLVGAGLPQLRGRMGNAKSYAERLFDFPEVGPLRRRRRGSPSPSRSRVMGRRSTSRASTGSSRRRTAMPTSCRSGASTLGRRGCVADRARRCRARHATTIAALDESFFRVRFDRLTPAEKKYLRAMAELGPGPHRSGDIADACCAR